MNFMIKSLLDGARELSRNKRYRYNYGLTIKNVNDDILNDIKRYSKNSDISYIEISQDDINFNEIDENGKTVLDNWFKQLLGSSESILVIKNINKKRKRSYNIIQQLVNFNSLYNNRLKKGQTTFVLLSDNIDDIMYDNTHIVDMKEYNKLEKI